MVYCLAIESKQAKIEHRESLNFRNLLFLIKVNNGFFLLNFIYFYFFTGITLDFHTLEDDPDMIVNHSFVFIVKSRDGMHFIGRIVNPQISEKNAKRRPQTLF